MEDIRTRLINATFDEIYTNGYHATSLANILTSANTKKGSMYHYFSSKKELVLAMIEEKLELRIEKRWKELSTCDANIIDFLIDTLNDTQNIDLQRGCPLGNLLQESINDDEDFTDILTKILHRWKNIFVSILHKAAQNDEIKDSIDIEKCAIFLIASIEGALLIAKKSKDRQDYEDCMEQLTFYLYSIKK
ncbi:MAG: TetR/AcrR family transcriptional regulator [Arcobacteraceae bacterium]